MQEIGAVEAPPTKEQLIAHLNEPLKRVLEEDVCGDSDPDALYRIWNARRNYLMFRGFQWLAPTLSNDGFADLQAIGTGYPGSGGGNADGDNAYAYSQNNIRGKGRKFIAVLGQRAPNVIAEGDDPDDEKGSKASRTANTCNSILDAWWDIDERNMEVAQKIWTIGPAFIYTPWNADGDLYGWTEEPQMEAAQMPIGESQAHCQQCGADNAPDSQSCQQCGAPLGLEDVSEPETGSVPKVAKVNKYPNGRVECYICDTFTVTVPSETQRMETCDWLRYQLEENKGKLLSKFEQLRKKPPTEGSESTASVAGKEARDSAFSPSGTSMRRNTSTRWTYTRTWLRPWMYEFAKSNDIRKVLHENYPTGIKITQVGGEIVDLEEEQLDMVWAVGKPETGENVNVDPVCQDLISSQLLTNHMLNIGAETLERGIPITLADPRVYNFEQINRRSARPAEIYPALATVGDNLSDAFWTTQPAVFSNQQMPFISGVEEAATEGVGVTPAIFGGGDAAPTAREAEIRKNAAMMQLGVTWTYMRKVWERAKRNGVLQLAKYGPGIVREGKLMADLGQLSEGGWTFHADEAIPATWGQQRDLLMFMMEKPPEVLQAFGYNRPENIEKANTLLGMQGWYVPGRDDVDKTRDTIYKLLQGSPQQGPDGSLQPSIPADKFEDDHQLVVQYVQGWSQSIAGRTAREQNPEGYANVIAWGTAHSTLAQPPPPTPPPPPPPKLSFTAGLDKMPPEVTQAVFKDFNLAGPPSPPAPMPGTPPQMPGNGAPNGAPPAAAGPPQMVQ